MTGRPLHVLGVVASMSASSRTRALVEVVLDAAAGQPAVTTEIVTFADRDIQAADGTRAEDYQGDMGELLAAIDAADAVVFGMPVYRASQPGSLKNLLDAVPRGQYDGNAQALRAKPVAIAARTAVSPCGSWARARSACATAARLRVRVGPRHPASGRARCSC